MIPVRAYFRLLTRYLRPLRWRAAALGVVLLVAITLQLINPQIVAEIIDRVTTGGAMEDLVPLAVTFMVIAVVHQVLAVTATWLAEYVGWSATNDLRAELTEHVLELDMGFHKTHTPGELIERIDGDVISLSNFFSAFIIKVLGNAALLVGILVLLWRENPWVGLGVSAFTLVALFLMLRLQVVAVPWWQEVRATSAVLFGALGEQFGGTEDIRANGGSRYMIRRFTEILRIWLPQQVRGRMGFALLWGTNITNYVVGSALVFWLGSLLFGNGTLTLGSVYLIWYYVSMTRDPMDEIRTQMEDFQKAGAGIVRVQELFATETRLTWSGDRTLPAGPLSVSLDHVRFSYADEGDDGPVLHDVSFAIEPGRVLGVLGRTGSGKTTLARLLTRLYDPQAGSVVVGGVPLPDADRASARHRIGMVTQDVQLFRATIRDNLTFFDPGFGDDRILDVIDTLGLSGWLATQPAGLDTMLESGGSGLSAGQAQLLALTRIFLRDPGLVIMDEASSRLDPATETLLERAVDRLLDNRTALIIAHRLATVTRADDILIMEAGGIVEHGRRLDLAADPDSRLSHLLAAGIEEVLA
jgi:ATP-binding cassette, subfamily B, bacterial